MSPRTNAPSPLPPTPSFLRLRSLSLVIFMVTVSLFSSLTGRMSGVEAQGSWPTTAHDNSNTGRTPLNAPTLSSPNLIWSRFNGTGAVSYPVVGPNGWIYTTYDTYFVALDANGVTQWNITLTTQAFTQITLWNGIVYFGGELNSVYKLIAANATNGQIIWTAIPTSDAFIAAPLVANGTLYAPAGDSILYAFDALTGAPRWNYTSFDGSSIYYGSTIDGSGNVYLGNGDFVYSFNTNGQIRWQANVPGAGTGSFDGAIILTPQNDLIIPVPSDPNGVLFLTKIRASNGAFVWNSTLPSSPVNPMSLGTDGTIYVPCFDKSIYAVNGNTGNVLWSYGPTGGALGGTLLSGNNVLLFPSKDGYLYALNTTNNGSLIWKYSLLGGGSNQGAGSVGIGADGTIYAGNNGFYALSYCVVGSYCPVGALVPISCPAGAYCPTYAETSPTPCTASTYNPSTGSSSVTSCLACTAGNYCPAGSSATTTCTAGNYCPASSSTPTPCPASSYNPSTGGSSATACLACTAGNYCPTGSSATTTCTAGNYCPASSSSPTACPASTYNPSTGSSSAASCLACTAGNYCPTGSSAITPCPAGSFCPASSSSPTACTTGSFCPANSATPTTCTAGNYCPAGSSSPTPCPANTYNPNTGASSNTSCTLCSSGTQPNNNRTQCVDIDACAASSSLCASGVTCYDALPPAAGTVYACGPCPAGSYGSGVSCTSTSKPVAIRVFIPLSLTTSNLTNTFASANKQDLCSILSSSSNFNGFDCTNRVVVIVDSTGPNLILEVDLLPPSASPASASSTANDNISTKQVFEYLVQQARTSGSVWYQGNKWVKYVSVSVFKTNSFELTTCNGVSALSCPPPTTSAASSNLVSGHGLMVLMLLGLVVLGMM